MKKSHIEEVKLALQNQWNLGWYRHESLRDDLDMEFLDYFKSKNFRLSASLNDICEEMYTIDMWWDNTKTYESYFQ